MTAPGEGRPLTAHPHPLVDELFDTLAEHGYGILAKSDLDRLNATSDALTRERDKYQRMFRASDKMLADTQVAHVKESLRADAAEQRATRAEGVLREIAEQPCADPGEVQLAGCPPEPNDCGACPSCKARDYYDQEDRK